MARTIQVILTDDIDGSAEAEPVTFALNGTEYTIDLSAANQEKLDEALKPYIAKAKRVSRRRKAKSSGASASGVDTAAARKWALDNGYKVSDRGRIPGDVLNAYLAAN